MDVLTPMRGARTATAYHGRLARSDAARMMGARHEPRFRLVAAARSGQRTDRDRPGDRHALGRRGRPRARLRGGGARAGGGRQRDRRGCRGRAHPRRRPPRHGERRRRGADPRARRANRRDLPGVGRRTVSAYQMATNADKYRRWPTSVSLFLKDGRAYRAGEILVQGELGETLRRMARAEAKAGGSREAGIRAARDEFYRGETARRIAEFHRAEDGPLSREDLADFRVEVAPALTTPFGAYEVAACGFWCQGPVLLQMLNLLDGVNLAALGHNSPAYLHRIVETVKLAFADRDAYYGDPRFVAIPAAGLLSEAYAGARRVLVGARAWPDMPPAGDPHRLAAERRREAALPLAGGSAPARSGAGTDALDTSYVAVVDEAGNGFSATPSDPNVDSPVVPGVGCVVSPRGSQGWLDPEHPSVVAPGKRPRLTPAPAMAFTGGRLFMTFGTPGGDVQQQAMLQVFLNVTVFGMELQAAVEAPRLASRSFPDSFWPHAMAPGKVEIERRIPRETRDALAALGHVVAEWPEFEWRAGAVCGVRVGPEGTRWAGADPRRGSHAIAR